jgi:lipoyl(octanoyl) transferase
VEPLLLNLGCVEFEATYAAMKDFANHREIGIASKQCDQLWLCEHFPVYTQGVAGKPEHILNPNDIPVIPTNRGGQVTYHGPGQVVAYPLVDLLRAGYFVKEYVYRIEESVIRTLMHFGVTGHRVRGAPGIYVRLDDPFGHGALPNASQSKPLSANPNLPSAPNFSGLGKIAALGIKVSRHGTYHGVALNAAMDLEPFTRINPCGYSQLQTIDLSSIGVDANWDDVASVLGTKLISFLTP